MKQVSDNVLVKLHKPAEADATTKGAKLFIPKDDEVVKGTIVSVGPGNGVYQMIAKEGDEVIFPENVGKKCFVDDVEHVVIKEELLLGIL